jgi:hypothetical protein
VHQQGRRKGYWRGLEGILGRVWTGEGQNMRGGYGKVAADSGSNHIQPAVDLGHTESGGSGCGAPFSLLYAAGVLLRADKKRDPWAIGISTVLNPKLAAPNIRIVDWTGVFFDLFLFCRSSVIMVAQAFKQMKMYNNKTKF